MEPVAPTMSPSARENQIINEAMNLAEKQIREGTASSQVTTFFLKLGAEREREKLEREKLENENRLLQAKVEALQSNARIEELYKNAINAMQHYGGVFKEDDGDEE